MEQLSRTQRLFVYGLAGFLAFQVIAAAPIFFAGLANIMVAGAATAAVLNGGYQLAKHLTEKDKYPKYEYQAPDGSRITVDPEREQVTRRLSKDFARAADFRKGQIADLVTKKYSGGLLTRTVKNAFDHTLNFAFNKYARVNAKTMQETEDNDQGATELFVMEKYLRHAQEQHQKDKAAKAEQAAGTKTENKASEPEGIVGAAPATQQPRKNKNAAPGA